jgi:hypothetical protein
MKSLRTSRVSGLLGALALCTFAAFMGTPKTVCACNQNYNLFYFYAEPALVTKVGQCETACIGPSVCTGTRTSYFKVIFSFTCPSYGCQ